MVPMLCGLRSVAGRFWKILPRLHLTCKYCVYGHKIQPVLGYIVTLVRIFNAFQFLVFRSENVAISLPYIDDFGTWFYYAFER